MDGLDMSKAETEMVYISRSNSRKTVYHKNEDDCRNWPHQTREVALSKIESHYQPCTDCAGGEEATISSRSQDFECQTCGTEKSICGASGYRVKRRCHECRDLSTWERIND